MNNLNKNIIELIYKFVRSDHRKNKFYIKDEEKEPFKKEEEPLRLCSKYISKIVGRIYFSDIIVDVRNCLDYKFRYFVHKYNLSIRVYGVENIYELSHLNTYNIKSIQFDCTFEPHYDDYNILELYYEYLLPLKFEEFSYETLLNCPINKKLLPQNLKTLEFNNLFNRPLKESFFPINLKCLIFGSYFNQSINEENVLPKSLEELIFGYEFNSQIGKNVLPSNLKN